MHNTTSYDQDALDFARTYDYGTPATIRVGDKAYGLVGAAKVSGDLKLVYSAADSTTITISGDKAIALGEG